MKVQLALRNVAQRKKAKEILEAVSSPQINRVRCKVSSKWQDVNSVEGIAAWS